ncbi:RNA-directed DNA polymerase, eukaryota, reverse transcriptase zinc-binding domain protein [Tanacetum coccineum]
MVKDFRPISLIGCLYKIIAKILTNRLVSVIGDLVNEVQSAFVAERQILDGPFILNEVLQWCRRKKKHALIFKVDFEKAYDSVRWDFLDDVLKNSVLVTNGEIGFKAVFDRLEGLSYQWTPYIILCGHESWLIIGLEKEAWKVVVDKVLSRLSRWKMRETLSIGGRFTILKSVLVGFFNCQDSKSQKVSWVKWDKILTSKDKGGLGVPSLYALNRGLMLKWIWRFYSQKTSLWTKVIKAIHGVNGKLDKENLAGGQTCWMSIVKEVKVLKGRGVNVLDFIRLKLGNGELSSFWDDKWYEGGVIKELFPRLYDIETILNATYFELLSCMSQQGLSTRWVKSVPSKVNITAWKIKINALPTRFNLSCRGMDIDSIMCLICNGGVETTSHLFFQCELVRQIMRKISIWWNVDYADVSSYEEWLAWLVSIRIQIKLKGMMEGVFYGLWWSIWNFRNKILFEDKPPKKALLFDNLVSNSFNWLLRGADGNVMGIHDFLCLPEWTGSEVQEEPHHDIWLTLQWLPFYCTPPAAADAVIPDPTLEALVVGTLSIKILAKAEASQKRKASISGATSSHVAKRTRSTLALDHSGSTTTQTLVFVFMGNSDEKVNDDECLKSKSGSSTRSPLLKFLGILRFSGKGHCGRCCCCTTCWCGVAGNCEFTCEEWDAPYRPTFGVDEVLFYILFLALDVFGGNTRDLDSFGEEMDMTTTLHQILEEVVHTERGDGVASFKRWR